MDTLYVTSVWLHILAAAVWIGGMAFLALILLPVMRRPEYRHLSTVLVQATGVRFRWIGWLCLGILIITGVFNVTYWGFGCHDVWNGVLWQSPFGRVLAHKVLLVVLIVLFSIIHDFKIGPRATALGRVNPASRQAIRLRRQASWIGRLNLVLAVVVVALAVMLARAGSEHY